MVARVEIPWIFVVDTGTLFSKLTLRYLNVSLMSKAPNTRNADSGRAPIALGRRLFQIAYAAAAEAHEEIGLTPFEFGVLIQLHDSPGIDQNTLAEQLAMDRTTTSALVYQLEQKKLIERAVDPGDRRARVLRLAPAGVALHKKHRAKAQAAQERLLAVLTPAERRQLVELLVRIIESNQHYARAGAQRRRRTKLAVAASR